MAKVELNFATIESTVNKILSQYAEFCFLLGSAATPRFNEESDVDIAVFWKKDLLKANLADVDFSFKLKIIGELEEKWHREVDLVSLNQIDVIYGMQVLETGRILIDQNSGLLLTWKYQQLSRYPDFKFSRNMIEKNILARKKYV